MRIIKLIKIKPLDIETVVSLLPETMPAVFAEEGMLCGGIGESLVSALGRHNIKLLAIDKSFPEHGSMPSLLASLGLDAGSIKKALGSL